jgi:hypothetical protein
MAKPTPEQWQQGEQDLDARLGPALFSAAEELRPMVHGADRWLIGPDLHQAAAEQYRRLDERLQVLRLVWWQRQRPGQKPTPWWKFGLLIAGAPVAVFAGVMAFIAVICLGSATVFLWAPFLLVWLLRDKPRSH